MASENIDEILQPFDEHAGDDDMYLEEGDVLDEVPDDGDQPMDDEDDGGDQDDINPDDIVWEDNSIQAFSKHEGSVFAVSAHPRAPIVASGGEDDLGYIWDLTDGEPVVRLSGHTDSVTSTAWNHDGEMIATGGMDGKVRVWKRVGRDDWKNWEFVTEVQGPDEVMWLRWHPKGNVLLAGSNDTTVWLWNLPSGNTMQVFSGHLGPVQCGDWTPDGKRIVTADAEGTLIFWDPRSADPVFKLTSADARFAMDGITSLSVNLASTLAVVGGQTGSVRVVSLSKGEVVGALQGHAEGESVEAVQFVDITGAGAGAGVVVTGATDGKACVWDLSTMRLRATLEHQDAITSLMAHPPPQTHLLVTGSADKTLKTWDVRTGTLIREHKGHTGPILGATLGQEGAVVVSAGDDGVCLVFATE